MGAGHVCTPKTNALPLADAAPIAGRTVLFLWYGWRSHLDLLPCWD